MFVRKKRNHSGTISVQIVSKRRGLYRVEKTLGCSRDPDEIEKWMIQGQSIIENPQGQLKLLPTKSTTDLAVEAFVENLSNSQIHTMGPELIFGALFDRIGFNAIGDVPKDTH